MFLSPSIEDYQLDQAYNVYDVLDSIYADPVTQGDIDETQGFDDYQKFVEGNLQAPRQPHNAYYMKGWLKHENDLFKYLDWEDFCS